jgi:hypothetical protein
MVDFLNLNSPALPAFNTGFGATIARLSLAPSASDVLSAINRHTPVDVVEADSDEDGIWFRLRSEVLPDEAVFQRLSNNWVAIGGRSRLEFSLVYCLSGQGGGVWLCHRSANSKTPLIRGCQRIISW